MYVCNGYEYDNILLFFTGKLNKYVCKKYSQHQYIIIKIYVLNYYNDNSSVDE